MLMMPSTDTNLEESAKRLNESFDKLGHQRSYFSLRACEHLIAVAEACKAGRFNKRQMMYMFEYVKAFSWALTDDLRESVAAGASTKVEDDSFFRALIQNLKMVRDALSSAPKH